MLPGSWGSRVKMIIKIMSQPGLDDVCTLHGLPAILIRSMPMQLPTNAGVTLLNDGLECLEGRRLLQHDIEFSHLLLPFVQLPAAHVLSEQLITAGYCRL